MFDATVGAAAVALEIRLSGGMTPLETTATLAVVATLAPSVDFFGCQKRRFEASDRLSPVES